MSEAMVFSLSLSFPGRASSQAESSLISIAETSLMVFPSILKQPVSFLSLVPPHTGHTIFSSMSSATPAKLVISLIPPSPTRNISSEPYTRRLRASSGMAAMGS